MEHFSISFSTCVNHRKILVCYLNILALLQAIIQIWFNYYQKNLSGKITMENEGNKEQNKEFLKLEQVPVFNELNLYT